MATRSCFAALVVLVLVLVVGGSATAAQPLGPGCFGGYDFTPYGFLYRFSYQEANVPHFALYPPVYYSDVVPRTYGYSPFAYPPYVQTPEVVPAPPVTISNPYVPTPANPVKSDPTAAVTIRNHFVSQR